MEQLDLQSKKLATLIPIKNKLVRTSSSDVEPETLKILKRAFMKGIREQEDRKEASRVRRILGWPPYGASLGGFMVPDGLAFEIIGKLKPPKE